MNTFQLIISAYNTIIYNGLVVYCGVKTQDGSLGLEARHESILCVLKENSAIQYRDSLGTERSIQIANGMLSFKSNECIITVGLAVESK